MKINKSLWVVVLVVIAVMTAFAEGPAAAAKGSELSISSFPGQAWTALGTQSPVEHGDIQSASYIEQGVTIYNVRGVSIIPYASLGFTADTYGFVWNNKSIATGGIKFDKLFRHGVITFGTGYSYENRFQSNQAKGGVTAYVQDWFGWQSVASKTSRFPGSTWAAVGNISPIEHNNLVAMGYVQQGVVARRFGRVALVPYTELTLSRDTVGFDWENREIVGTGVKAALPLGNQYVELGAGYLHEDRFQSGLSANGLKVFMNASFAWRLLGKAVR